MDFYGKLFLGFYCLCKKFISEKNYPHHYAVAAMAGTTSFFYFALTYLALKRNATTMETVGVFLVLYALHHFLFIKDNKYSEMEKAAPCTDQWIYRSILFFVTGLSLLMYVSSI